MCGIVGVVSHAPVNQLIYDALLLLQHRGQDAAGIVTQQERKFFMHKAKGMVRDVFRTRNMRALPGNVGLGQVRYPTAGSAASEEEFLIKTLDTDEGARRLGEFAFGTNFAIQQFSKNILFDEKIAGSFHLTPGNAYDEADNGNRSKIHWDLVQIQRPEYGGGVIAFDGAPIRVDGKFVVDDLKPLDAS